MSTITHPWSGHYIYNNKIWTTRQDIVDNMLSEGVVDDPMRFWFNDDVYEKIDWTVEPDISLDQLYINRAKQLRDEYDYLILSYSGGADSHEILEIYLNNNIFIDEIQVFNYEKCIERFDPTQLVLDRNLAIYLEYSKAVVPELKRICERSPNTKITVIDVSDELMKSALSNNYEFIYAEKEFGKTVLNGAGVRIGSRHIHLHNSIHFKCDKSKVAFIRGFEKPLLISKNDELFVHYNDLILNGVNLMRYYNWNMYTIENFFWSRYSPLIQVKQAHIIKKAFQNNIKFYNQFLETQQKNKKKQNKIIITKSNEWDFDRAYIPYIYKYWRNDKFVARKPILSSDIMLSSLHLKNQNSMRAFIVETSHINDKYKTIPKGIVDKRCLSQGYSIGIIKFGA